jgi:uncharacterized Rmd1/YagE family protein
MVLALPRSADVVQPTTLAVRALHVGARIDTRTLDGERVDPTAIVVAFGRDAHAVVFRFGSVVLFGGSDSERRSLLDRLTDCVREPYPEPDTESARVELLADFAEGVRDDTIVLKDATAERLTTVADVLAKSVALARYEELVARVFGEVDALARSLERTGRPPSRSRTLTRRIGATLLMETRIVGRAEVDEKPELLWERPELERLWERLVSEYEVRERSRALSRKLELVARANGTILELIQTRRSLRVEILIVLLIVLEVAITVYELVTA